MRAMVFIVFVAWCASQPLLAQQPLPTPLERAMSITWDGAYGMPQQLRPAINWWQGCVRSWTSPGAEGAITSSANGGCVVAVFGHDEVSLQEQRAISQSAFVQALKAYQVSISRSPSEQGYTATDDREMQQAQSDLESIGL